MSRLLHIDMPKVVLDLKRALSTPRDKYDTILLTVISIVFDGYISEDLTLDKDRLLKEIELRLVEIFSEEFDMSSEKVYRETDAIIYLVADRFNDLDDAFLKIISGYGINPVRMGVINVMGNTITIGR